MNIKLFGKLLTFHNWKIKPLTRFERLELSYICGIYVKLNKKLISIEVINTFKMFLIRAFELVFEDLISFQANTPINKTYTDILEIMTINETEK